MNEKSFISLINDEDISIPEIDELEKMLSDEIAKDSPDFDLIDEISKLIIEMKDLNDNINIENRLTEIKRRSIKHRHKTKVLRFVLTAAASIVLVGNIITVNAKGESFLAAIINQTQYRINFDFKGDSRFNGEGSQKYDPYGIKQRCEEFGFIPEAPMYVTKSMSYSMSCMNDMTEDKGGYFKFIFSNDISRFTVLYFVYDNPENMNEIGIKNDVKDYEEITVNDHSAVFATYKTDFGGEFYGVTYRKGNVVANFFFEQVDNDEMDKIIKSIE